MLSTSKKRKVKKKSKVDENKLWYKVTVVKHLEGILLTDNSLYDKHMNFYFMASIKEHVILL